MKAHYDIPKELFNNDNQFTDPFFKRFSLRHRSEPLKLAPGIEKDYLFPTLYGDVTCAQAVFLCDYEAALAMMPDERLRPLRLPKGRTALAIACYIYRNVLNVAPYNEIAMTIPVLFDTRFEVPVLPLLFSRYPKFGYHVFNMPVTSQENCIRGNEIWGLPKVTQDIDIDYDDSWCRTRATDAQGNEYLQLSVPVNGSKTRFDVSADLYSVLNGQLLRSKTCFNGEFRVRKNTSQLFKRSRTGTGQYLELGSGAYADQLRVLDIDPEPLQLRFTPSMNACFDLPDENFVQPAVLNSNTEKVA